MSKFTDSIREALAKKQAANHPDVKSEDAKNNRALGRAPIMAKKPQKKVTGRGR